MAGFVDQAAAHVLSNNEILMSAPSNAKLSGFYPTPAESTNTIAQAVCNSGQLFVRSNSKLFNSASDFQVSTANILDSPKLTFSITIPASTDTSPEELFVGSWQEGWGYDLIQSIEVSYSNSNISNLQVSGQALRDWSLLQCKNEDERKDLLRTAGRFEIADRASAKVFRATVPLSFLNWRGGGGVTGGFPIDARTLNGSIQFQIRFRLLNNAIGPMASVYNPFEHSGDSSVNPGDQYRPGVTSGFPNGFTDLEMTFRTYQLMDSAFSVAHALQANPGMVYSMPSVWVNTYRYTIDIGPDRIGEQQLNSAPAGMIQALLISVRPIRKDSDRSDLSYDPGVLDIGGTNLVPVSTGLSYRPAHYFSLPLSELRLQYSGQSIFDAHTKDQLEGFYKEIFCDDLSTEIAGMPHNGSVFSNATHVPAGNKPNQRGIRWVAPLHVIPLMHNGDSVFRKRHFENLPHYSGSTLSLRFKVEDPIFKSAPFANANDAQVGATANDTIPRNMDQEFKDFGAVKTVTQGGLLAASAAKHTAEQTINRVELQVTYFVAALLQSTNGVVELQL